MMAITIFFAMLGMLSPASRGALLTASIFLLVPTVSFHQYIKYITHKERLETQLIHPLQNMTVL